MIETADTLRSMLQGRLAESHQRSHALGVEIIKGWQELDAPAKRTLKKVLAKEHAYGRWLLRRIRAPQYLADWAQRINRDVEHQAAQAEGLHCRFAAMSAEERAEAQRVAKFYLTGLFTRGVQ